MSTTAKVICDSISESRGRITTMVLEYPRIIHSEFMTHRMFSRNASSSRAIPVEKQIERIENEPFIPTYWGANQKGMQASHQIGEAGISLAIKEWEYAKQKMLSSVNELHALGVHKQLANRLLEPFSHIQVIVTATEWEGFYAQRIHPAAQPEIQELARAMKAAMDASTPNVLKVGEWHLPFINEGVDGGNFYAWWRAQDEFNHPLTHVPIIEVLRRISVARCARVSYGLNERGWGDIEKDLALYDMLLTSGHWSPFEHQATPLEEAAFLDSMGWPVGATHMDRNHDLWSANFKGWVQNRQLLQQL